MPRCPLTLAVTVILASLRPLAAATPLAVPLVVEEAADVVRRAFPATASVPLPRGRVRDPALLWLAGPAGRPAPLQAQALEHWPDGTIRWLLLDFLADVPAGGHATYTLRDGKPPPAGVQPRLRIEVHDGDHVLDTGTLRATVPAAGGVMLSEASLGKSHLGPVALPTLVVAGAAPAGPVGDRVVVETSGPVRTELLLTGQYPQGVSYELRLAFFAGQRFVRLEHTVTSITDQPYLPIRSLTLGVPGRFASAEVGVQGGSRVFRSLARAHELRQTDATAAAIDRAAVNRGEGWALAGGAGLTVTLVSRYFWQEYPKAFRLAADQLGLDLIAGGDAPVRLGSGAAKTHELWLAIEPTGAVTPAPALAAALRAPLLALPSAGWIVASGALPRSLAPDSPAARNFLTRLSGSYARYREHVRTERWDDAPLRGRCDPKVPQQPRVGLYGVLNWGDWKFPGFRSLTHGCEAWGNLEYDLPQVLGLAYAATGNREFFEGLVSAARHYRDVDVIHHAPGHPEWVGMNHPHKSGHFAFDTEETIDLGHTWTEGLITYYRLTGEVRALDAARGIADAVATRVSRAHNPRQFGWPMIALTAVYDATGQTRYRDAAHDYARAGLDLFHPTPAAGDWKMGILADGIASVHAVTGDERLRHWLLDYGDALLAEPARYPDPRYALPLGYLATLTHDARYAARARLVVDGLKLGAWGKPLAAMGRTGFRLLAPLGGETTHPNPVVAPVPRPSRPLTPPRGAPPRASVTAPRPR